jgi:hypothetical protein
MFRFAVRLLTTVLYVYLFARALIINTYDFKDKTATPEEVQALSPNYSRIYI